MTVFDLTQSRRDAITYMQPDTCAIVTVTQVDDGAGSYTETTTTTTSTCRFAPASGDEAGEDQIRERGSYRLALPRTAAISATSRVVFGGKNYRVIWAPPLTGDGLERIVGLDDA